MDTFGGPPTKGEFTFFLCFASFLAGALLGGGGVILALSL